MQQLAAESPAERHLYVNGELVGEGNQQMGDGGLIAQITDDTTGAAVVSDATWSSLVIHRAPLDTSCEKAADPDTECEFESSDAPAGWTEADFDDSAWSPATEWSADDVGPKDGYDEVSWYETAKLVWGDDLEVDNTILFRTTTG